MGLACQRLHVLVNKHAVAHNHIVMVLLHIACHLFNFPLHPYVILVGEEDDIAFCMCERVLEIMCHSVCLVVDKETDAGVFVTGNNLCRAVRRLVV